MPFRNGTGPVGLGLRTGRGAGYYAGRAAAGLRTAGPMIAGGGRHLGGRGFGACRGFAVLGRCNPLFTIGLGGLTGLIGVIGVIGLINRRQTFTSTPEPVDPTV